MAGRRLLAGTTAVVLGLTGIYVWSQVDPEHLYLPFATFRNLAANSPIFLGGLVLGWHRDAVGRAWQASRLRVPVDLAIQLAGITVAFIDRRCNGCRAVAVANTA